MPVGVLISAVSDGAELISLVSISFVRHGVIGVGWFLLH